MWQEEGINTRHVVQDPEHATGVAPIFVDDSGEKRWMGGITKEGRKDLCHAMIEAAHIAAPKHPSWRVEYHRLQMRMPKHKATIAVARKLLVVWQVMAKEGSDQYPTTCKTQCLIRSC